MSRNTARYSRPLHQPGLYQRGTNRMKVLFKKTMKIFNSSYTFLYTPIRSKYIIKFDVNSALLRSSSVQSHSATDRLIIQHRRQHPRKARHMPFIFMLQQHPPHTTTKKCKKIKDHSCSLSWLMRDPPCRRPEFPEAQQLVPYEPTLL